MNELPYIADHTITDIKVNEYDIPIWIEFEFEGDRYRCALSPHLTLEEVVSLVS